MSHDDYIERSLRILADLYDLKEDVMHDTERVPHQPDFEAGLLAGAIAILNSNLPDDDPRVLAEDERQLNDRLARAMKIGKYWPSASPDSGGAP